MPEQIHGTIISQSALKKLELSTDIVRRVIEYTHGVLDQIDRGLWNSSGTRLASLVELANLSAIIGNIFRSGVCRESQGVFIPNKPHTYPDLKSTKEGVPDIEIKVALEDNYPKGHLVKPGPHITVRYVLANENGQYERDKKKRGGVAWIWEVRIGQLEEVHFSFSNTDGDSGKTAPINPSGMDNLSPVFIDLDKCPYSPNGSKFRELSVSYNEKSVKIGHSRNLP